MQVTHTQVNLKKIFLKGGRINTGINPRANDYILCKTESSLEKHFLRATKKQVFLLTKGNYKSQVHYQYQQEIVSNSTLRPSHQKIPYSMRQKQKILFFLDLKTTET